MQHWQLELGGALIARIDADSFEFPWTYGTLVDSPQFERFRVYFTNDENWPESDPVFESLCGEIDAKGGFAIREMSTNILYRDVRLNQENNIVWFRHGDPAAA
jgi:hypothetical protein